MKNSDVTRLKRTSGRILRKKQSGLRSIARKSCPDQEGCKFRRVIDLTNDFEVKEYVERVVIDEVIDLTD